MLFRFIRSGVVVALAAALGACANLDLDTSQNWFAKPLDVAGRNAGGYTFSELAESKLRQRPITPNDLVDNNGACPLRGGPQAAAATSGGQVAGLAPAGEASSLLGGGVALGMSECDVVARAGQPSKVDIGKNPNGDRTAVLTFVGGPRAGMYRFERGALVEMDAVAQASNPKPVEKKKKTAKSPKPPQKKDQS